MRSSNSGGAFFFLTNKGDTPVIKDTPILTRERATTHDVIAFIISQAGPLPADKIHCLLYYTNVWSLVWNNKTVFQSRMYITNSGPRILEFSEEHGAALRISSWPAGDVERLNNYRKRIITIILNTYGKLTATQLLETWQEEKIWQDVRESFEHTPAKQIAISKTNILKSHKNPINFNHLSIGIHPAHQGDFSAFAVSLLTG